MKIFAIVSLIALSSFAHAAADWKVVAATEKCDEKAQVLAKEGEKFVVVKHGDTSEKLASEDGTAYNSESMTNTVFSSSNYSFTQPSVVEGNPPKFDVHNGMTKTHCRMSAR